MSRRHAAPVAFWAALLAALTALLWVWQGFGLAVALLLWAAVLTAVGAVLLALKGGLDEGPLAVPDVSVTTLPLAAGVAAAAVGAEVGLWLLLIGAGLVLLGLGGLIREWLAARRAARAAREIVAAAPPPAAGERPGP